MELDLDLACDLLVDVVPAHHHTVGPQDFRDERRLRARFRGVGRFELVRWTWAPGYDPSSGFCTNVFVICNS